MKLLGGTSVGAADLNLAPGTQGVVRHSVYNFRTVGEDQSNRFLHFKTNVPRGGAHMVMIEAVGYNYGVGQPVRCSWAWYSFSDNNLYSIAMHNLYNGLVPGAVYQSADNFVCISTQARNLYYAGFVLNAYTLQHQHGPGFNVQITAEHMTTTPGNHF